MRLINNNKSQNIITDNDITMTGIGAGHSLQEIINELTTDINTLKSNVKWMYKYGGVGSGAGSGGGGGNSNPWNYKVELNGEVYKNDTEVNLGTPGDYKLKLTLYKVQDRNFDIKVTWPGKNNRLNSFSAKINHTTTPYFEQIINLDVNGSLKISINDDEGNNLNYELIYIVTAYQFELKYVLVDIDGNYQDIPIHEHNIFVNDMPADKTLKACLDYVISTPINTGHFIYTDWNNQQHEMELSQGHHAPLLDLGKEIINSNAGNYNFFVDVDLTLQGNIEKENIEKLKLSDNIIPSDIYLKVTTGGEIYETNDVLEPYSFYTGNINFNITPYDGPFDSTVPYDLIIKLDGVNLDVAVSKLIDRLELNIGIVVSGSDQWHSVEFEIVRNNKSYIKKYWIYTINSSDDFVWYPKQFNKENKILPVISYSFHASNKGPKSFYSKNNNIHYILDDHNNPYTIQKPIEKIMQNKIETKFHGDFNLYSDTEKEKYKLNDYLISVGLKYNKLNDINNYIFKISGLSDQKNILIYLNGIEYNGTKKNIYIPKDNQYHLITIYRRAINKDESNMIYFEIDLYLDGVLEATLDSLVKEPDLMYEITLNYGLYSVNYLEMSYFKHKPAEFTQGATEQLSSYNLRPEDITDYFNDEYILYHYYSYKLSFMTADEEKNPPISKKFQDAYKLARGFYYNQKTNRVEATEGQINTLAELTDIPILMLEYLEPKIAGLENWESDGEDIFKWMDNRTKIENNPTATKDKYKVIVKWASKNDKKLNSIDPGVNTSFNISLLGTSTLLYKSKNFDLFLESSDSNKTYLYSPNYDPNDSSTFLPELRFTLKADVVDSSHSNNNVIGHFINTISSRYSDAKLNSKYDDYIKNTLEGFPVLLFFKNGYYENNSTTSATYDCYYFGIYNFNLGRDTEYNLGYKDLRLLPSIINPGFNITSIDNTREIGNETLYANLYVNGNFGVTEVLENKHYFDFSLYHDSILFPLPDDPNDRSNMFGKMKSNNVDKILKQEIRNLVEGVSRAGGYIFDQIGKTMLDDSVYQGGYDCGYISKTPMNIVPNYKLKYERKLIKGQIGLECIGKNRSGSDADFKTALLGTGPSDDLLANPLIDYLALSDYYVCCMALGMVDSVQKNLNLKTWNGKTFYPSFYDMDTALGKSNSGSDIGYMAFSDYWEPRYDDSHENWKLLPAISYKDWAPINMEDPNNPGQTITYSGYDTPMTYLFALAKYGYTVAYNNNFLIAIDKLANWYPNNLWARFRRSKSNNVIPEGLWGGETPDPASYNHNHIGCLENADSFIKNYYKKHLENIPDVFFNLNYRKKYYELNESGSAWYGGSNDSDFKKFSGKRLYYVHDWLENRLHILDLYFNISGNPDQIMRYDTTEQDEKNAWKPIGNTRYALVHGGFVDPTNPDIKVLKDIFNETNSEAKFDNKLNVIFKAEENSPMCITGVSNFNAIIENNLKQYVLNLNTNNNAIRLGGSGSWTYVDKIDSLLQSNKDGGGMFYVNSDKLTNLNGSSGSCGNWKITLPALLELKLTGSLYTGNISFDEKFPNLEKIDISNSKLGLKINKSNVLTIVANNVKSGGSLNILNCPRLNNVSYKNSWFENIVISSKTKTWFFCNNIWENKDGEWVETRNPANSPKCKFLDITCETNDGVIFIDNLEYDLNTGISNNRTGLQKVTLKGFKKIYIASCSYLENLIINDKDNVESLEVIKCSRQGSRKFQIGNIQKHIDLTEFKKLKHFNFYETAGFTHVSLPINSKLTPNCFYHTDIQYLKGNNIKICNNAFYWSGYTLYEDESKSNLTNFDFTGVTNLDRIFSHCNVSTTAFLIFNKLYMKQLENITSADYMWYDNPVTYYTDKDLNSDVSQGKSRFNLISYPKVKSAVGMIGHDNSNSCHPDLLEGLGEYYKINQDENFNGINIENIFGFESNSSKNIILPINWLDHVKTIVNNYNLNISLNKVSVVYINKNNKTVTPKTKFKVHELLPPNRYITTLENWIFDGKTTISFEGFPFNNEYFPNLLSMVYCFCNCSAEQLESKDGYGFLYNIPDTLTKISSCFGFNNFNNININLSTIFNWGALLNRVSGFDFFGTQNIYNDFIYHIGETKKYIEQPDAFISIFKILHKKCIGKELLHVFENCTIYNYNDSKLNFGITEQNPSIENISFLFKNLIFKAGQKSENNLNIVSVDFDWSIIKKFKNLKHLVSTFENMKFKTQIPFNFFGLRLLDRSEVFVKLKEDSGEEIFKTAYLYKYTYKQKIEKITNCFKNCQFDSLTFTFNNRLDNTGFYNYSINDYEPSYVMYEDSTKTPHYVKEYYNNQNDLVSKIVDNPDYDDLNMETDYMEYVNGILSNIEAEYIQGDYQNFRRNDFEHMRNPFITPDFFYGCVTSIEADGCFEGTNLEGYIPDHMFKYNPQPKNIKNFIKNVLIFPKKINGIRWGRNEVVENSLIGYLLWYYIGHNFIMSSELDDMFNFRIALSNLKSTEIRVGPDGNEQSCIIHTLYIFSFIDSFHKDGLLSIKNAFNFRINGPMENFSFNVLNLPSDICLNLMYDDVAEEKISGENNEYYLGNLGINIDKYKKLLFDRGIPSLIILFTYGNLFYPESITLRDIQTRNQTEGEWAFEFGNGYINECVIGDEVFPGISYGLFGISRNIRLPEAPTWKKYLIYFHNTKYDAENNESRENGYPLYVRADNLNGGEDEKNILNYNSSYSYASTGSIALR